MDDEIVISDYANDSVEVFKNVINEKIDLLHQKVILLNKDTGSRTDITEFTYKILKGIVENEKDGIYNENKELIDDYNKYINAVRELFDGFKIKDELLSAIVLRYMIKKGYFSVKGKFAFEEYKEPIPLNDGLTIITGRGCCRNMAYFYSDVFDGIYKHPLAYGGFISDNQEAATSNHVINLASYNDRLLGYDLTNGLVFRFLDKEHMFTDEDGPFYLNYSTYWDLVHTKNSYKDVVKNLELYDKSVGNVLSPDDHNKYVRKAFRLIDNNKFKIIKFNIHTHKIKKEINEKTLQLKKTT